MGPMQWTAGGFVPAGSTIPNTGAVRGGFIRPEDDEPVAVTPPPARAPQAKPVTPKGVVAMAKARLREVKSELRRMKALEKEKGELERLIAAAEHKPSKPNLREIKRTTG